MNIIIAPAKRMRKDIAYMKAETNPVFLKDTRRLLQYLKSLSCSQLQQLLECSEQIAQEAYQQYQHMQLLKNTVPALLAYDGIQYTYMAPEVFDDDYFAYARTHVYILSGFYGILRSMDGVVPYRLELNHHVKTSFCNNLYTFWNDKPYKQLIMHDHDILDLASVQYSRLMKRYIGPEVRYVRCCFMEEEQGKLREKGVYVKMARGEMVRYLAEIKAQRFDDVKTFRRLGYQYRSDLSNTQLYIFTRNSYRRSSNK